MFLSKEYLEKKRKSVWYIYIFHSSSILSLPLSLRIEVSSRNGDRRSRNSRPPLFDRIRTDPPTWNGHRRLLHFVVVRPNTDLHHFPRPTDEFRAAPFGFVQEPSLITAITWSFCYVFPATWPPETWTLDRCGPSGGRSTWKMAARP